MENACRAPYRAVVTHRWPVHAGIKFWGRPCFAPSTPVYHKALVGIDADHCGGEIDNAGKYAGLIISIWPLFASVLPCRNKSSGEPACRRGASAAGKPEPRMFILCHRICVPAGADLCLRVQDSQLKCGRGMRICHPTRLVGIRIISTNCYRILTGENRDLMIYAMLHHSFCPLVLTQRNRS